MNIWKPINTIPKDGKLVVCKQDNITFLARWVERRQCMLSTVASGAGECGEGIIDEYNHLPCEATYWTSDKQELDNHTMLLE